MERKQRIGLAVVSGGAFALLEAALGLLHPAQGLPYSLWDLPLSLLGWSALAALLALPKHGERLSAGVLLALVLPVLLGSPWWALLGLLGAALPKPGLAVFAALGLLSAWLHPRAAPVQATQAELPGLVLITVDTLRFDHAEHLLEQPPLQAVSAAPWTLPSMDSLMLGVSALEHGGGRMGADGVTRPLGALLAERLAEEGYVASAWVCNPHLRSELGFGRGFESFVHSDTWRDPVLLRFLLQDRAQRWTGRIPTLWRVRDRQLISLARQDIERGVEGRFVWLHILGPHEYLRDPVAPGLDPEQLYTLAVQRSGRALEPLLQAIPPGTRVLVISDHGESLGEEGRWGHGTSLSDPQLLVPAWTMGLGAPPQGTFAAWELPAAVFEDRGLEAVEVVAVTGVRGDPSVAALRAKDGYRSLELPQAQALEELNLEHLDRQLQALGYQDLWRDTVNAPETDP